MSNGGGLRNGAHGEGLRVVLGCEWFVKYTAGLARGLADAGCEVVLVTRDHDSEFGDEPGAMRRFVAETLGGRARHMILPGRFRDPARLRAGVRLRRMLGRFHPDIVHVQDSLAKDPVLAFSVGLPGRPYALTIHDPAPHLGEGSHDTWTQFSRNRLFGGASLVFAHAAVLAEELRVRHQVRAPIEVVPHGFATTPAAGVPNDPALLFFGRILPYKGVDTLLEAMPLVWRRMPEVELTVAGENDGGVDLPAVREDSRVTIRDEHVPESGVAALFDCASLLVLPYRQATQSGVGAIGKQYGRGMVVTAVGGLPEAVTPQAGRVVPPDDPDALAAAIINIFEQPGETARMAAEAARLGAIEGWDRVAEQTIAAYRLHLLKGRR